MSNVVFLVLLITFFSIFENVSLAADNTSYSAERVNLNEPRIPEKNFELEMMNGLRKIRGSFDPYGVYTRLPPGSDAWTQLTTFGMTYRFNQDWDGQVLLPIRHSEMYLPSGSINSTSIGGLVFDGRFHAGGPAHIVLRAGVGTPWKIRSGTIKGDPTASLPNDFGDGLTNGPSLRFGVGGSHTFESGFRTALDFGDVYSLKQWAVPNDAPSGTSEIETQNGNRFSVTEGISYKISTVWTVNMGFSQAWASEASAMGSEIPGTATRAFSTKFGCGYVINPAWKVAMGFDTMYPFYKYEVGQTYGPGASVMIAHVGN